MISCTDPGDIRLFVHRRFTADRRLPAQFPPMPAVLTAGMGRYPPNH